jgi:hypothetical protein
MKVGFIHLTRFLLAILKSISKTMSELFTKLINFTHEYLTAVERFGVHQMKFTSFALASAFLGASVVHCGGGTTDVRPPAPAVRGIFAEEIDELESEIVGNLENTLAGGLLPGNERELIRNVRSEIQKLVEALEGERITIPDLIRRKKKLFPELVERERELIERGREFIGEEYSLGNNYAVAPKLLTRRKLAEKELDFFIPLGMKVLEYAKTAPAHVLYEYKRTHIGFASPFNTRSAKWDSCGPTTPFVEYNYLVATLPLCYMGRINRNPSDDILCRKPFSIEVYNLKGRRWIRVKVAGVNYSAKGSDDIRPSEKAYALINGKRGTYDRTAVKWRFVIDE